jgi:hypothetical protein
MSSSILLVIVTLAGSLEGRNHDKDQQLRACTTFATTSSTKLADLVDELGALTRWRPADLIDELAP